MKILLLNVLTTVILFLMPNVNFGQAPDLGAASGFALFTSVGAFNLSGSLDVSSVTGDVGTNAGAFYGFPPGTLNGQKHIADAVSLQAVSAVSAAYIDLAGRTCGITHGVTLGSEVLSPNIYCLGAASTLNGTLTLDGGGNPDAIFIFQINGALATSVSSNVIVTNSASLCNVFWQVNGEVDLGSVSVFRGTILANGAINILAGATLQGRALSQAGAISLYNNIVTTGTEQTPSTISAGGPTTFCAGGNVILSGNVGGIWSTGETTPSITVTISGDYFVTNTNACGSVTSNHINVTVNPLPVPTITGLNSVCQGMGSVIYTTEAGMTNYLWTVSPGGTITAGGTTSSNTVTVNWNTTGSNNVSVNYTNANSCSAAASTIYNVSINAAPIPVISGADHVTQGQSVTYSTPYIPGHSYFWSVNSGNVVICLPDRNCITVTWILSCGDVNPYVTVTETIQSSGCSATVVKWITVTP